VSVCTHTKVQPRRFVVATVLALLFAPRSRRWGSSPLRRGQRCRLRRAVAASRTLRRQLQRGRAVSAASTVDTRATRDRPSRQDKEWPALRWLASNSVLLMAAAAPLSRHRSRVLCRRRQDVARCLGAILQPLQCNLHQGRGSRPKKWRPPRPASSNFCRSGEQVKSALANLAVAVRPACD
jgi:hypothetical protein